LNRKTKFMLGSALIVAAVGALIYGAVRETSAYFVTMDEYARNPAQHEGQPLRLAGRVADGSVKWDPKTLDLEFVVRPIPPRKDGGAAGDAAPIPNAVNDAGGAAATANATLPVRYNGILPDMFAAGRDVIVEGRVESGVFQAKALLTTCPSKYEAERKDVEAGSAPATEGDQAQVAPPGAAGEAQSPQAATGVAPDAPGADSSANETAPDHDAKPNDGELLWADLA
jgi:cytochrome c-type biogenesis protein CcmE